MLGGRFLELVEQDKRLQVAHPCGQLQLALVAYALVGVSSSGVEQMFSKTALKFNDRMGQCNDANEELFLRVCMGLPDRDAAATLEAGQQLWAKAFGVARCSQRKPRFDKRGQEKASTLRRRRECLCQTAPRSIQQLRPAWLREPTRLP